MNLRSALFLVAGCGLGSDPHPTPTDTTGPFVYAQARHTHEPRPARFAASLPTDPERLHSGDEAYPPRPWLVLQACAGDPDVLDRVVAAHRAASGGTVRPATLRAYASYVAHCPTPARCSSLRVRHGAAADPVDKALAAAMSVGCPDARSIVDAADTPASVVLSYYGSWDAPTPWSYSVRLGQALRGLEPSQEARMAAVWHGKGDDPRVAADLLAAAQRPTKDRVRAGIMRGLGAQSTPAAQAVWSAWCATHADDWACEPRAERSPRQPVLEDEAAQGGPPSAEAARLVALGLAPQGLRSAGVFDLDEAGVAVSFDTETGMFPNAHDGLLAELAAAAGGPLSEAVFAERPPSDPGDMKAATDVNGSEFLYDGGGGPGVYVLSGWARGERWDVVARDLGDWYDVPAVLGMLNTMSRDLGAPTRFVALPTGDQMSVVLPGDEAALTVAIDEGLLGVGSAAAAAEAGKASEAAVLEMLLQGEL